MKKKFKITEFYKSAQIYIIEADSKEEAEKKRIGYDPVEDDYWHENTIIEEITEFKPYDKVLVNKGKECPWCLAFFAHYDLDMEHYPFVTLEGQHWMNCIPFKGNEEKLGTEYHYD